MDLLLPDKLLVRVSTFLDLPAILAFRSLSGLTPPSCSSTIKAHAPSSPFWVSTTPSPAPFSAPNDLNRSRELIRAVAHRLVCRPHRNRRYSLRLETLPKHIRNLVHHPDYGLDTDGFAKLLHGVFLVSPPMALHLVGVIGLAGPGWMMGVIADNGSAKSYAQEMCAAMLNFGQLVNRRLDSMRPDVAFRFSSLAVPSTRTDWTWSATMYAGMPKGRHEIEHIHALGQYLPAEDVY